MGPTDARKTRLAFQLEIGEPHHQLLYLLLPHSMKMNLLSESSRARLEEINRRFNETAYSGDAAANYDQLHRYGEAEQHDCPLRELVEEVWAREPYGRAIEIGAGSGYVTEMIARQAKGVVAVELVPDMQRMIRARCRREALENVEVVGGSVFDLQGLGLEGAFDSAFVIQTLHHLHRRREVFAILYRLLRPGGRLFLLEPHHNVRRVARLFRYWLTEYRRKEYWTSDRNWATHDFVTRGELRSLCQQAGFQNAKLSGYWIPGCKRLFPERRQRFAIEQIAGRVPGLRHVASVVAIEARRPEAER